MQGKLPLNHWYVQSVIRDYARELGLETPAVLGDRWYKLSDDDTLDAIYAALEAYAAQLKADRRAAVARGGAQEQPLTAKELAALAVTAQDNLQAPGCWSMPQLADGVQVQTLNRLEKYGLVEQRREKVLGKRPERFYRITDAGMTVCAPALPAPVVEPHTTRPLSAEDRALFRAMFETETDDLSNRMVHALHIRHALRRVVINGDAVTICQQWPDEDNPGTSYSAASFLRTLTAFIRLNEPASVITHARVIERKLRRPVAPELSIHNLDQYAYAHRTARLLDKMSRSAWVIVTFHLAGETIPLLAAPAAPVTSGNGSSNGSGHDDDGEQPEPIATVELPEQWTALSAAQQAALLMLYEHSQKNITGPDRWLPLDGLSDAERRQLDHELLIMLVADGTARIGATGMDLVEQVQDALGETQEVKAVVLDVDRDAVLPVNVVVLA